MAEKNIRVKILKVSDTGYNPYTSVLMASQKLSESEPELLQKVKQASIKGWLSYLKNSQETNAYIEKVNPANKGTLNDSTKAMLGLMSPQNADFGNMSIERWQLLAEQLHEIGTIKDASTPLIGILK